MDFTMEQEQLINKYCDNEMRELKKICDPILFKKGITKSNVDYDELLSLAMDTLTDSVIRYDGKQSKFITFLTGNIKRTFYDFTRDSHRGKRCNLQRDKKGKIIKDDKNNPIIIPDISLDAPVNGDNSSTYGDFIVSDFDISENITDEISVLSDEKVEKYFNGLSEKQRKVANLIMNGYEPFEIKEKLKISDREYNSIMSIMKSYDNSKILRREIEIVQVQEENNNMETLTTTSEKTKDTHYSIESICKKMKRHQLRDDHVLQRPSGQWSNLFKSELVSDVLQGKSLTQIIVSEEIKNGITMHWLIDGKQRCTNLDDFLNNGFAISKNVQRYLIAYQTTKKDENGNDILTEEGFAIPENKTFDIRKKKFSQLPEELQDKFKEYQIPVMLNLNCTKKEIAYDIARFNRCRPMNVAQNGWTGLDEGYAEFIDNILKMNFFAEDCKNTSYRNSNNRSGMLRRMIVEAIMTVNYIDDFNKDFRKMCEYISGEANDSTFIEFYSMVEKLNEIADEEFSEVFTIKDSFIWFGLFSRFEKLGIEDSKFVEFVKEFNETLHAKEIDGVSFDKLSESSTKDKKVVIRKVNHLEKLMYEFLHIEKENLEEKIAVLDFVKENVNEDITEEDIKCYEEDFEILTLDVKNDNKLLEKCNRNSIIAMIAYSYKEDKPIDEWFVKFFEENNTYIENQKDNFLHMKDNLNKYLERNAA